MCFLGSKKFPSHVVMILNFFGESFFKFLKMDKKNVQISLFKTFHGEICNFVTIIEFLGLVTKKIIIKLLR